MVPRKVEELPKSVALAKQIITTLVDFSNLSEEELQPDALASSAANIAALFVSVGDLYEYPAEISKVFLQCFSSLSMQIPMLAMLVALMHRNEIEAEAQPPAETQSEPPPEGAENDAETAQRAEMAVETPADPVTKRFCEHLVNEQLRSHLLAALKAGEILRARLLLRTLACLVCCRSFRLSSFTSLLTALLQIANEPFQQQHGHQHGQQHEQQHGQQHEQQHDSYQSQPVPHPSSWPSSAVEALFLLASSVQWVMGPLTEAADTDPQCEHMLAALETLFARVQGEEGSEEFLGGWALQGCPFRVGGPHQVFHSPPYPNLDPSAPAAPHPSLDPSGLAPGVAQDSLSEALAQGLKMVRSARSVGAPFIVTHRAAHYLQPWTCLSVREGLEKHADRMMAFDGDMAEEVVRALCERTPASTCLAQPQSPATPQAPFLWFLTPRLCLFDQDTSPEAALLLAHTSPLDRHLAHTFYSDVVCFFQPQVNEDGTRTGSVELLARHLLAVSKLFAAPCDGSREPSQPLHLEYLLIEHLFQLLLQPPTHLLAAFHAGIFKLLLVLCRTDPLIPPVVALAANIAFQMAPDLDPACWRELARWFSFHLTNTKLSWPYWDFWLEELRESQAASADREDLRCCRVSCRGASAQSLLVRIVVERCTRSSLADRVLRVFPSELAGCVPPLDTPPTCPLLVVIANPPQEEDKQQGESSGEGPGLDESMISVDTNMAVAASASAADADTSLDQLTLTPYPSRHVGDTDLAGALRSQVEARTDPEDVEDWVTARRRDIYAMCMEKEETRRLLAVPLPAHLPPAPVQQEEEDRMDAAAASLLLQCVVSVGGGSSRTLSGLLGLLDRYSEVLRGLAPGENETSHAVLMWTLVACYRHDSGTLQHLLDELLRRGLIAVTAAADWLTHPGGTLPDQYHPESPLLQLLRDPYLWDMWESCVERSLDFVRAAVAQRRELGGLLRLDEDMDLTPPPALLPPTHLREGRSHPATLSDEPEGPHSSNSHPNPNLSDDLEVDYTDDLDDHPTCNPNFNNEDDDEEDPDDRLLEGRRTRQKTSRGPGTGLGLGYVENSAEAALLLEEVHTTAEVDSSESAVLAAAAMAGQQRGQRQAQHPPEEEEEQEDPVAVYSELVRQAVYNARRVYHTLLRALVRAHGRVGEAGVSLWQGVCQSLMRRVIGSFADAELVLSEQHQQRVVLTGSEKEVRALLSEEAEEKEAFLLLHREFYRRR